MNRDTRSAQGYPLSPCRPTVHEFGADVLRVFELRLRVPFPGRYTPSRSRNAYSQVTGAWFT